MSWQQSFFDRYLALEPDEALTLGAPDTPIQLRDLSPSAQEERLRLFTDTVAQFEGDDQDQPIQEQLDRETLRRHQDFEQFSHKLGITRRNPQWAMTPYSMLRYRIAQNAISTDSSIDEEQFAREYCSQIPSYLEQLQDNLRSAKEQGLVAHAHQLKCLIEYEIPGADKFVSQYSSDAAQAYEDFIDFLKQDLCSAAPEQNLLGREHYEQGLKLTHGTTRPLQELIDEAKESLRETQDTMVAVMKETEPELGAQSFDDVAARLVDLQGTSFAPNTDIRAVYREIMTHCVEFMSERGEFEPIDVNDIGMADYPEGMRDAGPGTNWPVPLLSNQGKGQFVVHPHPEAHSLSWKSVLAIHEGVPGHYLQSQGFRKHFRPNEPAVRFMCVADDVAIPRINFLSMLSIEGYAVYAEEIVRRSGFHSGHDHLFALSAHALRAARLIAEAELHCGVMAPGDVPDFVASNTGLPSAIWELERYMRGPFQAPSYFLGAQEFLKLRQDVEAARGAAFNARAFHEELFSFGPVLPSQIRQALLPSA